jgi:DNA-binding IclR family transcriptional regulator
MSTARDRPPEEASEDTSFARGLRLLLAVADRGEVRADDLGSLLDMPPSTVYRYLRTLTEFGFVDRAGGIYRLGPRLLIGEGTFVSSEELIRLSDPVLRMLVEETGETAVMSRRIGLSALCLLAVQSHHPLRVAFEPGAASPLHHDAIAKVLLAYAPPDVIDEAIAVASGETGDDGTREVRLRDELAEIVRVGLARSEEDLAADIVTIAIPILRRDGIVAAIGVAGPSARCGLAWRTRVARLLPDAAATVQAELGTPV